MDIATTQNRVSRSSPTKAKRRTAYDIQRITDCIYAELAADHPMTVRQMFYRLVSKGVIAKTESEYKQTVCRLASVMRRRGDIPYGWFADGTRWQRKPQTHSSLQSMLDSSAKFYRRSLWNDQDAYVEIWLEKEALAGVLYQATSPYDVPLMVTRGYPSLSYLFEAAEAIAAENKPTYLYYFGDRDPSGVDIPRKGRGGHSGVRARR
ncbi:MAG TPA: hypothetical protein VGJ26_03865 [Pirellulales bacterium]